MAFAAISERTWAFRLIGEYIGVEVVQGRMGQFLKDRFKNKEQRERIEPIMARMKFSNIEIDKTIRFVEAWCWIRDNRSWDDHGYRRFVSKFGAEHMPSILEFMEGMGVKGMGREINRVMQDKPCVSLKGMAVNGKDLIALGIKGRGIGIVLESMLSRVLMDPSLNTKERLLKDVPEMQRALP